MARSCAQLRLGQAGREPAGREPLGRCYSLRSRQQRHPLGDLVVPRGRAEVRTMTVGTHSGARTGGFILLEVLVGLILLSLTLGLFALTLGFASRIAEAGRLRDRGAEIAVGAAAISGWLAGALPLIQPRATERPLVMFEG